MMISYCTDNWSGILSGGGGGCVDYYIDNIDTNVGNIIDGFPLMTFMLKMYLDIAVLYTGYHP